MHHIDDAKDDDDDNDGDDDDDDNDFNGSRIFLLLCSTYRGIRKSVHQHIVLDKQEHDQQAASKDKFAPPSDKHLSTVVFEYAFVSSYLSLFFSI